MRSLAFSRRYSACVNNLPRDASKTHSLHLFVRLFAGDDEVRLPATVDRDTSEACQSALQKLLEPLVRQQHENNETLTALCGQVSRIEQHVRRGFVGTAATGWRSISGHDVLIVLAAVCLQMLVLLWLRK